MAAPADGAGVPGKRGKPFLGQQLGCRQRLLFLAQQMDLVQRHPQIGVDTLLGCTEVTARIQLMAADAAHLMGFTAPEHHRAGHRQDRQAQQQNIEGFVTGPGRAHDLGRWSAHGASMSAWSISTT
ncbi:hypothetical protein D3C85_1485690 [compost metagenome]